MVSHLGSSLDQSWRGLLRTEHVLEVCYGSTRNSHSQRRDFLRKQRPSRPQTSGGAYYGGILNNRNDPGPSSKRPSIDFSKSPTSQVTDTLQKFPPSPRSLLDANFLTHSYNPDTSHSTSQPPVPHFYPRFPTPKPSHSPIRSSLKAPNRKHSRPPTTNDFSLWTAVVMYLNPGKPRMRSSCPSKLFENEEIRRREVAKSKGKRKKEVKAVVNLPVFKWAAGEGDDLCEL